MKRRLRAIAVAAALTIGATLPAAADPTTLIAAAAYFLTGSEIAAFAIALAGSIYMQNRAKRKARDAYNASLSDRIVAVRGANEPRRMVLGRQRVGGVVAFIGSTGVNKEQMVMVIALAAHECDAIEQIYFNDKPVDIVSEYVQTEPWARDDKPSASEVFHGDGVTTTFNVTQTPLPGTVTAVMNVGSGESFSSQVFVVTSLVGTSVTLDSAPPGDFSIGYQYSKLTSFARVRTFLGGAGQTVDSVVQSLFPPVIIDGVYSSGWDSSHPMTGCAGLCVFFNYNEDAFQTDVQVSAVMRGAKVYDPRLDSTAGGSGSQRVNNPATWTWSENPALLIGYAAMSELCGRQPSTAVRWTDVAVAANVCDEQVDYSTWGLLGDGTGDTIGTGDGDPIGV